MGSSGGGGGRRNRGRGAAAVAFDSDGEGEGLAAAVTGRLGAAANRGRHVRLETPLERSARRSQRMLFWAVSAAAALLAILVRR